MRAFWGRPLESRALKGNAAPTPFPRAADERESLLGQVAKLEAQLQRSQASARAVQVERDGFREQASQSYTQVQQLLLLAKKARTDLRTEKQKSQHLEKLLRSAKLEASSVAGSSTLCEKEPVRPSVKSYGRVTVLGACGWHFSARARRPGVRGVAGSPRFRRRWVPPSEARSTGLRLLVVRALA